MPLTLAEIDALSRAVRATIPRSAGWSTAVAHMSLALQEAGVDPMVAFDVALVMCHGRRMRLLIDRSPGALRVSADRRPHE